MQVRTSALNSVNSKPLQSSSSTFSILGGSDCSYVAGWALMFAECSLWTGSGKGVDGGQGKSDLTVLALPDKVGLAATAAHLVHFLGRGQTG